MSIWCTYIHDIIYILCGIVTRLIVAKTERFSLVSLVLTCYQGYTNGKQNKCSEAESRRIPRQGFIAFLDAFQILCPNAVSVCLIHYI